MNDLSAQFARAGNEIIATSASEVANELNRQLNRVLGWPYRAATGIAVDQEGRTIERLGTLIFTGDPKTSAEMPATNVDADRLACAIDVSHTLDLVRFRRAYARVAEAKRLKKSPAAKDVVRTTTTFGVIFSVTTSVPLEVLAHELGRMNKEMPSAYWPDMVVVASLGLISYAVQFPGEAAIAGQWLPPADGALTYKVPAIYVVMVIRPGGDHTFNKMMHVILAHLSIFSPGSHLPEKEEIVRGLQNIALVQSGYQHNMAGELRQVPPDQIQGQMLPSRPFLLQDRKGKTLAAIKFLRWQDGGVLLLWGELPLEGLLVFLGGAALSKMGTIKREGLQISYVLPIVEQDFHEMLQRLQQRSNIIVRADPGKFIVQRFADEGASSPFMARLFLGIIRLAETLPPTEKQAFEDAYHPLVTALLEIKTISNELAELVGQHARNVSSGSIVSRQGSNIHITESIDRELRRRVDQFLTTATRSFKDKMQRVVSVLHVNIGFLYQKQDSFERGIASLILRHRPLAEYLREARLWGDLLVDARNDLEHRGWQLPTITYTASGTTVSMIEPIIKGQPVAVFTAHMTDRLMCFVEDVTADCLQRQMPTGLALTEIPLADRAGEIPMRFQPTLTKGGMPLWQIAYHTTAFDRT